MPLQTQIWDMTVFSEHSHLGGLEQWKEIDVSTKVYKPVPESYICQFFLQMSQALAVLQNQIGPNCEERVIPHREFKPKNILVVKNESSAYPHSSCMTSTVAWNIATRTLTSPKSLAHSSGNHQRMSLPVVMSKRRRSIPWAACVYYIAIGTSPTKNKAFYAAHVPRLVTPINLTPTQQRRRGFGPYLYEDVERYNPQYTDELNSGMRQWLHISPARRPTAARLVTEIGAVAKDLLKKMGGKADLVDLEVQYHA